MEWDSLRLNLLLENPRWITQSRFKAVSTAGVSLLCCGCHEGVYGLSEALQRGGVGVCSSPVVLGGGVVDGGNTL